MRRLKYRDDTLRSSYPIKWERQITVLGIIFTADETTTRDLNYSILLQKIRAITTLWSVRSLTVIGKILVVNTLFVSKFVYKLMCIYSPTEKFLKEFRKVIMDFIWDSKKPKIACKKLIQTYTYGGLNLVDLRLKNISLKAAWIDRILFSGTNLTFLKQLLPCESPLIWYCKTNRYRNHNKGYRKRPLVSVVHF